MATSLSYMRDIMLGGIRDMSGDPFLYNGTYNNPQYTSNLPNYSLNPGLLGPLPFSQDAQILSEIAALRQMLIQALQVALHPPLMITSSEKMAPLMVTKDAVKALADGKLETRYDMVDAAGIALMSFAHPVERVIDWEKDGAKGNDAWPAQWTDEFFEKAEAEIEAEVAKMKADGETMTRAVSFLQHAHDGMPPRFIPQLD